MSGNNKAFIALLVVAMLLGGIRWWRGEAPSASLKALLSYPPTPSWVTMAEETLNYISNGSENPISFTINTLNNDTTLRLILFDSSNNMESNPNIKAHHRNNCGYLGDGHTIVCDVALFDIMIFRYGLDQLELASVNDAGQIVSRTLFEEEPAQTTNAKKTLLLWTLSHEIGHLTLGHRGQRYFAAHAFDEQVTNENYCHRNELEADQFLYNLLETDLEAQNTLFDFLWQLLNQEIKRQACPNQSPALNCDAIIAGTGLYLLEDPIAYHVDGSHPDYIIRLLRLLTIVQSRPGYGLLHYELNHLIENGIFALPDKSLYKRACDG